jgi:hypothetical protein
MNSAVEQKKAKIPKPLKKIRQWFKKLWRKRTGEGDEGVSRQSAQAQSEDGPREFTEYDLWKLEQMVAGIEQLRIDMCS